MEELKLLCGRIDSEVGRSQLLGVDGDGRLVVMEFVKGVLTSSSVSRILEYASYLCEMAGDELAKHVESRSDIIGGDKINDIFEWYQNNYHASFSAYENLSMILIGFDFDERADRMVKFLAGNHIDISMILFQPFQDHGELVIATYEPRSTGRPMTGHGNARQPGETKETDAMKQEKKETTLQDLLKSGS